LSELDVGESGVLVSFDLPELVQNHLMHMGFVPDALITVLRRAPAGPAPQEPSPDWRADYNFPSYSQAAPAEEAPDPEASDAGRAVTLVLNRDQVLAAGPLPRNGLWARFRPEAGINFLFMHSRGRVLPALRLEPEASKR